VTVIENGKKSQKGPGETVEHGAIITAGQNGVLLAGSQMAVEGAEGAQFSLNIKENAQGEVGIIVSADKNSSMVTVDTGTELVPLDPGTSVQVSHKLGEPPTVAQVANPKAEPVTVAAAPKAEEPAPKAAPVVAVVKEPPAKKPAAKAPADRAPAAEPATDEGPGYSPGLLAFFQAPSLPPPPPDTTNQDLTVVSPIAPK
jgi:hypothetical protein